MKNLILVFLATAAFVGGSAFGVVPRSAQADIASTIAALTSAISGNLLFDSSNQPFYVRNGQHIYVSGPVANYYVQQHDPQWYAQHRGDWENNRAQFAQAWNKNHHAGQWQNAHDNGNHFGQVNGRGYGNGNGNGHGNGNNGNGSHGH